MNKVLLRVLRRLTALEIDIEQFHEVVYDGLDLSVYELEDHDGDLHRAHAEHAAGLLDRPTERSGLALLTTDGGDVSSSPGETGFTFTDERHREINFLDRDESLSAARVAFAERGARVRNLGLAELKAYARARLLARDPEWETKCGPKPKWMKCIGAASRTA